MTLTIGHAAVEDPDKVTVSGGRVTFEGDIVAADVAEYLARREQLVGMVDNPDMDVWPVTWTEDATVNGYWWCRRAEVSPSAVALTTGFGHYRVELERPVGLILPLVENVTSSVIMTNAAGVTSASAASVWAVPGDAQAVESPAKGGLTQPAASTRTAETVGAVKLFRATTGVSSGSWLVAPGDFFDAAATVEAKLSGSTFYPMIGRSVPLTASNWRLSNGLVRVTPSVTAGKIVDVAFYNGTSWCTNQNVALRMQYPSAPAYTYQFDYDTITSAVVLRNSPECCTIRLTIKPSSLAAGTDAWMVNAYATLDLTLRRGEVLVRCVHTPRGAYGYSYVGVGAAAGAQTALTSGVRADGTVNSGRIVMAYVDTSATGNTTMGTPGLYLYRYTSAKFMIGYEIAGAGASTYNAAQEVIYQYLAALSEKQRVVLK